MELRVAFLVVGLPGLALALLAYLVLPDPRRGSGPGSQHAPEQ